MLKVAIVGCGRIFDKHMNSIVDLKNKFKLVSICDIDKKRLKEKSSNTEVNEYLDYNLMVSKEEIDVVSVLTDSGSHEKIINDLIGKVKNIIVEKPFTLTTSGARGIVDECKKKSTRLFVVHQNRLNRTIKKLFELKKSGAFGKIFLCSVNLYWSRSNDYYNSDKWRGKWKSDGGVIANQGIHFIDIIQKLLGDPYLISAESANALNDIEAEDTAVVNFRYKNNCLVTFQFTTAIRPKNLEGSISIFSENGSFQIGGIALNKIRQINLKDYKSKGSIDDQITDVYGEGHHTFYSKIYKEITEGIKSEFDATNFVNQIRLLNAIYKSIEDSQRVIFDKKLDYNTKLGIYES